ncbi:MAG TPA: glycoside hydrolase family 3 N-terminal domain-containing protein [Vicinamibacterales bacterium]|nr:glycoside hydrolase family 3 N-terminal domain-containing protein [Vicinamibacterales bacterium]
MRARVLAAACVLALRWSAGSQAPASSSIVESQSFLEQQLVPLPALPPADVQRIRDLLGRMTLKEKVGQMTQLEIGMVTDGQDAALRINPGKLRKAIVEYGVGALLNVKDLALSPSKWHELISAIQAAAAETRLKIPVIYGIDTIHGANYVAGATLFPQPLGMAATWDPALMLESSRIAAAETRAAGIAWNFSPVLDIGRQPLWPRLYETFGEDPYLASVMGAATVRGYQGADPSSPQHVAATLKHYVGYSFPTSGHDRTPALIPDITMREYFLPTFAAGVKAGALSVMVNSGEVNGVPGHVNKYLLTDVLRGELGFEGVIDSDWEDIKKLVTIHHVAATEKEATRAAVLAGIDMSMVPSDYSFSDLLAQLVTEGAVPIGRIDDAVTRILTMKARLGLFVDPLRGTAGGGTVVGAPMSRQTALRAARESLILLKNADRGGAGPVLPLAATTRVLVTGPTADSLVALNNGWTMTWQGDRAAAYPSDRLTIRRAIERRLGVGKVTYVAGADFDKDLDVSAASAAARASDVVVLCLGEKSYAEIPGNIDDLALSEAQLRLAREVAATGKPVVLILAEGRPRIINTIADAMSGIILALNPGHEGGAAIADVLFGDINPSGRLPITYPRAANALLTYDHKAFEEQDTSFGLTGFKPQFDFGFGLSYTIFEYSGLSVTTASSGGAPLSISVTVRNTGAREGVEIVQLFVSRRTAPVTPPVKRLKRFARVTLRAGAAETVRFTLTQDDLSYIGAAGRPVVEPGMFTLSVAGLRSDVTIR